MLPVTPARLGVVGTSAAYRPADGPAAGGDFYDVFLLGDGRVAVILGDISGHGRQALPHTALVRFTLRAYLEAGLSPRIAVQTAESVLERQLGGSFATVVVATYDPGERTLVYACAGHPSPLVIGSPSVGSGGSVGPGGPVESIESITPVTVCAAPPIGAGMRTGSRQTTVAVPGEAQVCFFTDGVTEARTGGELFGAERLTRALAELGPAANASQLLERVAEATDTRSDDMAACVLNIAGNPAAPAVLLEELELDRETPSSRRAEQLLLACGVPRGEIPELIGNARHAAGQAGTAIVELHLAAAGGPPTREAAARQRHPSTDRARARSGRGGGHGGGDAMSTTATLAPDAAMALGIAATAMPFARTPEGEAERWLRVLRLHGESGIALQALGVSEGPFETEDGERHEREPAAPTSAAGVAERDPSRW